jgi:hypothetical protein
VGSWGCWASYSLCYACRGDASLVPGPNGERPDWWWTGKAPIQGTPGVQPDGTITSLPMPNLATCTRQEALDYFTNRCAGWGMILSV